MLNNLSPIYHPANHLSTGTENSTRENLMSKMFYNGKRIFKTRHFNPNETLVQWANMNMTVVF